MGFESDLLQRNAIGWNLTLGALLEQRGLSPQMSEWLQSVLPAVELIVLVLVISALAAAVDRLWCGRVRADLTWLVLGAIQVAGALWALRLIYWVYKHPSGELGAVPARWDFLVSAILGGIALRRMPLAVRVWVFALLSVVFLDTYVGRRPFAVVLAGCLLGFGATRWSATNRPGHRVVVQGLLMTAVFVVLWRLRSTDPFGALLGWGFYSFALFRHVSFVVESARGVPVTLGGYLCFLLFFPNALGAMEVYNEFWERNLASDRARDYRTAALMVAKGIVLRSIAVAIPMTDSQIRDSVGFVSMWTNIFVVFFLGACGAMGLWNIIEGGALFLGVRLRPNFRGVLTATNPSQFWRAWRGTMTNWLIRYIYIPLGGNRRHQARNILAAFVVSTVWHCVGVPFLRPATWQPVEFAPLVLWGTINFVGVASHAAVRRRRQPPESPAPLRVGLLAIKWPLAMCFGSVTVTLLGFSLVGIDRFGHVIRTLVGLEGW
ncbi:MAG TPA: MBOAT family O-acyltransferase [Candidatus Binatia bacterium]|nr:MBOAT family O-acyltransferase [Candidatus Binatia bacterium]